MVLFLLCIVISPGRAGDTSSYELIGFSKDGKYVAFERYGNYDGTGFPYSEIFIVDVLKNSYVTRPFKMRIEDGTVINADKARDKNRKLASLKLVACNIVKANTGRKVYEESQKHPTKEIAFDLNGAKYSIILKEFETDQTTKSGYKPKIFELDLVLNNKVQILQKDTRLPASRGFPFSYHIDNVYIYDTKIAVIIVYAIPGFEEPNYRQIIVTGSFNSNKDCEFIKLNK